MPELAQDLALSPSLTGWLGSAFLYAYAATQIPAGLLVDGWGPRRTMLLLFGLGGMGGILFASAGSFGAAFAGRALVGVGMAVVTTASFKIMSRWFQARVYAALVSVFMAVGGLVNLVILLVQGWAPIGYWKLLGVCLVQGVLMWSGALPCVLLVVALNKSTILSVIITFFYTVANYITLMIPSLSTMPLGLNAGTLLPGALSLRWYSPFLSRSAASEPPLVQQLLAHAISTPTALGIAAAEAVVFIFLIALVYRRREP